MPLVDWLLGLLAAHGYLITLAATVLENTFVVGSFTPGETIVLAAGFVSSTGAISPWLVGAVAIVGSMVGSNVSYLIGRKGGRPTLERYGHRFHVSPKRLRAAEGYFHRHGSRTIFLARFGPGVKNFAPAIAGVSKMNPAVFEAYSLVGAAVYAAVFVALGFFFGQNFDRLLKWVGRAGWAAVALVVVLAAVGLWERERVGRKRIADGLAEERALDERGEAGRDDGE